MEITFKDFMDAVQYRITDSSDYLWECFGENAMTMESWAKELDATATMCFDKQTQFVYEVQVWDDAAGRHYRWIHPSFIEAARAESESRNVSFETSIDEYKFTDLEVTDDILEKLKAIMSGESYDTRIQVPLTLDDDKMLQLAMMAHERDMTLNQMVEHILKEKIREAGGQI